MVPVEVYSSRQRRGVREPQAVARAAAQRERLSRPQCGRAALAAQRALVQFASRACRRTLFQPIPNTKIILFTSSTMLERADENAKCHSWCFARWSKFILTKLKNIKVTISSFVFYLASYSPQKRSNGSNVTVHHYGKLSIA